MKSKKEVNTIKEEVENVSKEFHELTDEELTLVSGGAARKVDENHPPRY